MYCPKCNADITGTESACPVCGVPFIYPTTPPTVPTGAKMINPDSVAQAVQSVVIEKVEPKKATTTTNKKERKKIHPILLITIISLLGLGILYLLAFTNFYSSNKSETKNKQVVDDSRSRNYSGYLFDIPDGFKAKVTSNGLELKGEDLYFVIGIDYSNSIELYRDSYCSKYNVPSEKAKKIYGYKEYLLFNTRENGTNGSIYVTKGKNEETFIGIIIRKDNNIVQDEDMEKVFKVINTATVSDKKTKDDLGEFGLKIYHISPVFDNK